MIASGTSTANMSSLSLSFSPLVDYSVCASCDRSFYDVVHDEWQTTAI